MTPSDAHALAPTTNAILPVGDTIREEENRRETGGITGARSPETMLRLGPRRDYEATVYFWVRESRLAAGTDRALLDTLRNWVAQDWSFRGSLFVTNEQFTQQVDLIERTDLRRRFAIEEPDKPGRYLAYE